ncbi:MAG: Cys-Gln thioester bond-forming surface protein, partial [Clostridia bacterium]|nr:Cys-Gln thioester bond-forming surface protein [Clostridia bacterium]
MKKIFKSSLAWLLVLCMCLSNVSVVLVARAVEADGNKPETIWRGDEVTAEITAGKNGYTFVSVYRSPAHSYEFSNHALVSGSKVDIPQLFVLADASKDYTWSPDGRYSFGASNYEVLYCCDAETGLDDGIYYKRLNLEDSAYYDSDSAAHIRAILTNSYPYVSLEQMKANLIKAGVEGAENLDRAEILSAVQGAVWNFANGAAYEYKMSYNVTATPKYGIPMHDYTAELNPEVKSVIETLGNAYGSTANRKELADVGARVNAVIDYLMNLETVYAEKNQVIITDLEIVGANSNTMNGEYLATVRVNLNNGGSSENDNIKLDIYVDGVLATSRPVYREITSYDINISAKAGQTIKAVVSGTQIMPQDVYFYEPEGGRDVSQCLVGIASGETDVYAESQVVLNAKTLVPVDKFATPVNKSFQTTVTLQVPGDSQDLGVDIIYVAGAYLEKNEVEKDLMITSLYSTFVEIVGAGVPVSFGFVPFSYDDKPVMELTTYKTLEDLEANFRNDLVQAIEDASGRYGGENMENALQIAKNMFAASDLADHPERQHLVLVSSGHTYNFNVGENNEIFSTVPVAIDNSKDYNKLFFGFKAWMQARNYNPNNYPIPKAFTTYNDYRDWDAYWAEIEKWAAADVANGDKGLYKISDTTDYSYTYFDWYMANLKSDASHNNKNGLYKSYGMYIYTASDAFKESAYGVKVGSLNTTYDTVLDSAKHAISYERAMWEASNFIDDEITGAGINFYPIYNQMKPAYTNGVYADGTVNPDGAVYGHNVTWTQQYIGHSFMNMLARNAGRGLEAVNNSTAKDKAFFDPIKKQILYSCATGSYVEDYIGYDPLIGNFEFINDAERITLYVGEYTYVTEMTSFEKDEDGKIISASYSFTKPGNDEATFWLDYDYGNGTTTEMFRWTFGEDASLVNRLSLVYDLQLIDMVTEVGSYWIDTNLSAT